MRQSSREMRGTTASLSARRNAQLTVVSAIHPLGAATARVIDGAPCASIWLSPPSRAPPYSTDGALACANRSVRSSHVVVRCALVASLS